jgi:ABC-2 type transport system ATP-binding protein
LNIIELIGLTRRFGDLTAVDSVNLTIQAREIFGLLGPNGAGKTTVIKVLTTLLPPSSGTARVAGFDIQRQPARVRAEIAYVPQLVSADGGLTAAENLRLFAKLYGVPRREIGSRVSDALKFVGLEEAAHRVVRGYSGGMVRRLEIALALIHRPRVLFLDEPTVGLDPLARQVVWQQVRQLVEEFGMTILLTTHFMEEADSLCDRVAIMNRGQVTAIGSPAELKAALGIPNATLDDVFARHSVEQLESDGNFNEISRSRRSIARLG